MKEKLKPCPFCGGKAEIEKFSFFDSNGYRVYCYGCDSCGSWQSKKEEAINVWNTRVKE